jgi:hypothetical protein
MAYEKPLALMDTEWGERVGGIPQTPWKLIGGVGTLAVAGLAVAVAASSGSDAPASAAAQVTVATTPTKPAFPFSETKVELTRPEMQAVKKGSSPDALIKKYGQPGGVGPSPYDGESGTKCLAYSRLPGSGGWLFCFAGDKLIAKHNL